MGTSSDWYPGLQVMDIPSNGLFKCWVAQVLGTLGYRYLSLWVRQVMAILSDGYPRLWVP